MTASSISSSSGTKAIGAADRRSAVWLAVTVIALAGLALRVWAASGDLWLDEIWSFELLGKITSIDQILWRINHDNNHFLNSAWLYLTGPDASVYVQRGLSIAMGVATVFVAAAVTADRGPTTQIIAALLFAVSYPMVHFGSEARGYAGLILFSLMAVWGLQKAFDGPGRGGVLALAILLGFLSHLTMAATVLVLVAWSGWTLFRRGGGVSGAAIGTIRIFLPAFLLFVLLVACMAYGISTYGFTVGSSSPYSFASFLDGFGGMIHYTSGLPWRLPNEFLILAAFVIAGFGAWYLAGRRSSLYLIGIIGLPLLMMQLHLPNLQYPRYFLPTAVLLLLCVAELIARGFEAGTWRRGLAALVLVALLCGNGILLSRFLEVGRGSPGEVVNEMLVDGDTEYATTSTFRTPKVVDFFARRAGHTATLVQLADLCARRPEWIIVEVRNGLPPEERDEPGCNLAYDGVMMTTPWGLSGLGWALYRKR